MPMCCLTFPVLDRCRGEWVLAIDCDEWLEDIEPLIRFLNSCVDARCDGAAVTQRNYYRSGDLNIYGDVLVPRLVRMSHHPRYINAIHEAPAFGVEQKPANYAALRELILHHDGYVMLNDGSEEGRNKTRRNVELLRGELQKKPIDRRVLSQFLQAASEERDAETAARRAVKLVCDNPQGVESFDPLLLKSAVQTAANRDMSELAEWAAIAWRLYPTSYFTRLDVSVSAMAEAERQGRDEEAVLWGERFPSGYTAFTRGTGNAEKERDMALGSLTYAHGEAEQSVRILLARLYRKQGLIQKALAALEALCWAELTAEQVHNVITEAGSLRESCQDGQNTLARRLWDALSGQEKKRNAFLQCGAELFSLSHAWEIFLPLAGDCILGDAAELMCCDDAEHASEALSSIASPVSLPAPAFIHALRLGCAFPAGPLNVEDAGTLAETLAQDPALLKRLALEAVGRLPEEPETPALLWADALATEAVRRLDWAADEDAMRIARAYAEAERICLPWAYTEFALNQPDLLPPSHRFGIHCVRALDVFDRGDYASCVRALRKGLKNYPAMKPVVERLVQETQDAQRRASEQVSPELQRLAGQVRAILLSYAPDDPAVAALKQSAAYQKVAWLIER